ncbi:MAG: glycoside hydrolase family 92 protein [Sphingobacteriales bacterium]|nr:MAG: glycoside hydrolase family 92 protein [Sphingobacteriales bacterium]TAF81393.1 MAG: glycoside hydrolase family 92 protein [Sphingobacteriales bacterium]
MKKSTLLILVYIFSFKIVLGQNYTQLVNPMIGTGANGHVFPGATSPFGMIQLSPDQGIKGWGGCSGYQYNQNTIVGFSHTHLSGTGVGDLGDILMMPHVGIKSDTVFFPGKTNFTHQQEKASPSVYEVYLPSPKIKVRLTTTPRVGIHEYTFPKSAQAMVNINLIYKIFDDWGKISEAQFVVENDTTFSGYRNVNEGWAPTRRVYFVIKTNKAVKRITSNIGNYEFNKYLSSKVFQRGRSKDSNMNLLFETSENEKVILKVAISAVSVSHARINIAEAKGWDFDTFVDNNNRLWNSYLSRIKVEADPVVSQLFYTGLYHAMIQPNQMAEADSSFFGPDYKVHKSKTGKYYSTLSLWDTYRAAHPLYTVVVPELVPDMMNSMLQHNEHNGYLPIWALWGTENHCMIANHSVPVLVDAVFKGFKNIDVEKTYDAIKKTLTLDHHGSHWNSWQYTKYGYMTADSTGGSSVSKTLECAFNDWCAAQLAKKLGKTDDYNYFIKRSKYFKNLFNPTYNMMWPKNTDGKWVTWDAYKTDYAGPYTEGNAWQYIWSVQHNPYDLIKLFPSHKTCVSKLDQTFSDTTKITGGVNDVTGLIGQYAHGNEPSHHIAYFYNFLGQPWKTQKLVRQILQTQYTTQPEGLSGNEDCGQMSAWYVLSALGFYPYNPANGVYILGSPAVNKAVLQVGNGKTFSIIAHNNSPKNIYVAATKLNGKPYLNTYIRHTDIQNGGELTFIMTDKPVKKQTLIANLPPLN